MWEEYKPDGNLNGKKGPGMRKNYKMIDRSIIMGEKDGRQLKVTMFESMLAK